MKKMSKRRNKKLTAAGEKNLVRIFLEKIKDKKMKKALKSALLILAMLGIGFFAGRKTMPPVQLPPETVYLPGEPVVVEKPYPDPVYVRVPADSANIIAECVRDGKFKELFPERVRDSIIYLTKEDTAAVIRDWATERYYDEQVFDIDTVGTATVNAKVQYNRIEYMRTTFVPVQKATTVTNVVGKKYSPFVGMGITTMPEVVVNGGMYFDDKYGASLLYEYNWGLDRHAIGLMGTIKF
jgi:hypothetical protein